MPDRFAQAGHGRPASTQRHPPAPGGREVLSYRAGPEREADLGAVAREVWACRSCPRLVEWREEVAVTKRASFADQSYWGRPIAGFGDPQATLLIVGLAPAAHGGNRTGRIFTGDRSGDWLFGALWRAGYANQPTSISADDGLVLSRVYVTAVVRCAPPGNKPTPIERDTCLGYLRRELELLADVKVIVALGQFAYNALTAPLGIRPRPRFGHGVEVPVAGGRTLICSFHPSQQNTFTGKLTEAAFDAVFSRARQLTAD
ncbi:MAG: uracil-DNA glycosylase [Acidimicrobiales bacterium]